MAVVEDFEYLGCTFSHDCSLYQEISKCISKASQTFRSLYRQSVVVPEETEDQDQVVSVQGYRSFLHTHTHTHTHTNDVTVSGVQITVDFLALHEA